MTSIEFFRIYYSKLQKKIKSSKQYGKEEQMKSLGKEAQFVYEAIVALKRIDLMNFPIPLSWTELNKRKSRPIYIREKTKDTEEFFGWWDIIDDINATSFKTAYGEELFKKDKGTVYDVYDYEFE